MKNNIRINPLGLKGNEINDRMKQLMGILPINENVSKVCIELTKMGPDGKAYAIIRENHEYYIKNTNKTKNILAEDFKYIGGLQNKKSEAYPSYAKAIKFLNLKFNSIAEAYNRENHINVFLDDNLLSEDITGFKQYEGNGFGNQSNMEGGSSLYEEEETDVSDVDIEDETITEWSHLNPQDIGNPDDDLRPQSKYDDDDDDVEGVHYKIDPDTGERVDVGPNENYYGLNELEREIHEMTFDNENKKDWAHNGQYEPNRKDRERAANSYGNEIDKPLSSLGNLKQYHGPKKPESSDSNFDKSFDELGDLKQYNKPNYAKFPSIPDEFDRPLDECGMGMGDEEDEHGLGSIAKPYGTFTDIQEHKLSIARALKSMDAIIDSLTEGKKKVYTLK